MPTPSTSTRIPIALIGIGILFRIGAFLLWPLMLLGILAFCGLLAWVGLILYALPIAVIGCSICIRAAILALQTAGVTEFAIVASRSDYPSLWSFAEQVANTVGTAPPDHIIVGMAPNFYVTQSSVALTARSALLQGRTLYVSAPLLRLMDEMEISAVLAHEFAHFTGRDTVYSTQIAPAYTSLSSGTDAMRAQMGWNILGVTLALPFLIVNVYYRLFHVLNSAISRNRELRCDEIASQIYGETYISAGLVKVVGYGSVLTQYIDTHFISLLREKRIFHNYSEWFVRYAADDSVHSAVNEIIGNALVAKTQFSDSHPALKDRLEALNVSSMMAHYSGDNAFGLRRIEVELTELYTQLIRRQVGDYSALPNSVQAEALIHAGIDHVVIGEYREALEVFDKANELDSEFVYTYIIDVYGGEQDDHKRILSAHDIVRTVRQYKIASGISESVIAKRAQQGFPKAVGNYSLGQAAVLVSSDLAGVQINEPKQVKDEFTRRIAEGEYDGWVDVAYYRETWDMNTLDEEIIAGMTDVLCRQINNIAYEDFSVGVTCGYPNDDHSLFGVFAVIGYGCTDGSAYTLTRINEARKSMGVAPLELNHSLRILARNYISMDESPVPDQRNRDIWQSGYVGPETLVRHAYGGAYCPIPEGIGIVLTENYAGITYEEMGNLAATGLLADYEETLLRSDWQHIGIAARLVMNSTYGRSVQVEYVVAWQLPEGAERPAHFPPPIDEPKAD